jgi:hypothetical protein
MNKIKFKKWKEIKEESGKSKKVCLVWREKLWVEEGEMDGWIPAEFLSLTGMLQCEELVRTGAGLGSLTFTTWSLLW